MKTKKCTECGAPHYNKSKADFNQLNDTCQNCEVTLQTFWSMVAALNDVTPLNGRPRRIKILKYEIERV